MDEILVLGPGTFPPQRQNIRLLYGTPENRRDVVYRRRHGRQTRRPYTDHGPIVEYGTEAIDAFVLEDAGELYISWKAYRLDPRPIELLACKISDDGLRMAGEPFTLLRDDKRQGMEGQHWLKIGDYYYIVYSINGCCGPGSDYAVAVARSKNLRGPYERYAGNPILHGGGDVQSIGHGTVTTTPDGRMFYLCHAYLAGENFFLGRQPMLQEIVLGDDLWLHFTGGETASLTQPMPFAGMAQQPYSISRMTSRPTGSDPNGRGTILTRRPRSSLPTGASTWAAGPKRA